MKVIKKNSPELVRLKGGGFFGRALCLYHEGSFFVAQNVRGEDKGVAQLTFSTFPVRDIFFDRLPEIYFNRYKVALRTLYVAGDPMDIRLVKDNQLCLKEQEYPKVGARQDSPSVLV